MTDAVKGYSFAKKKYGNEGKLKDIPIQANFFKVKLQIGKIYHYIVDIELHDRDADKKDEKDERPKKVSQKNRLNEQKRLLKDNYFAVFERFYNANAQLFGVRKPIFDGKKNLFNKTRLPIEKNETYQVRVRIPEKKFPATFDIKIIIPPENELNLDVLNEKDVQNVEREIQALEIILAYGPKKNKVALGSNLFSKNNDIITLQEPGKIRFGLAEMKEGRFGSYQSVKLTEAGIQINIDRVAAVFNKGGDLINLIQELRTEMLNRNNRGRYQAPPKAVVIDDRFSLSQDERRLLSRELKGLSFKVKHISYHPKNTIYGISQESISQIFFEKKVRDSDRTERVSVKDYFEVQYRDVLERLQIRLNPNLPCIQVGRVNPKYFPMDVVEIIHDQYYSKKLNPTQQADMTRQCGQQKPTDRFDESKEQFLNLMNQVRKDEDFQGWTIQYKKEFTLVKGRVLEDPKLSFNPKCRTPIEVIKMGQWRPNPFVIPADDVGSNWMVVNYTKFIHQDIRNAPERSDIDLFKDTLLSCSRELRLNLQEPCEIIYDEIYKGRRDLKDAITEYINDHKDLKMIVFVIPQEDQLYHDIKFVAELEIGIATQCVSQSNLRKNMNVRQYQNNNRNNQNTNNQNSKLKQYVGNLLLKINPKLGGTNVHLDSASKVGLLQKSQKTMVMGLDVTHPSKSDRMGKSIASVVATVNSEMTKYISKSFVQPKPRMEMVHLEKVAKDFLKHFNQVNKFYPEHILMYRDGVSDGQFMQVVQSEINSIKKVCAELGPNCKSKLIYIIVQKRHNTRFLAQEKQHRIEKSDNVLPGTVVDNTITSNHLFDFYITSHYGPLGTSRPTKYVVLHDETNFTGDEIQKTTHYLTYLFQRCSKSISVCTPTQYSHLAAKRARSYLHILDDNTDAAYGENQLNIEQEMNICNELNSRMIIRGNLDKTLYFI